MLLAAALSTGATDGDAFFGDNPESEDDERAELLGTDGG